MIPRLKDTYIKKIQPELKEKFGFKNIYMTPKLSKVVINMGLDGKKYIVLHKDQCILILLIDI